MKAYRFMLWTMVPAVFVGIVIFLAIGSLFDYLADGGIADDWGFARDFVFYKTDTRPRADHMI